MGVLGNPFGGAKMPPQPKPTQMPDEQDPAILAARRRQFEEAAARSGRASTMLSDAYANDRLGGRS